jgi:hypothetical protein
MLELARAMAPGSDCVAHVWHAPAAAADRRARGPLVANWIDFRRLQFSPVESLVARSSNQRIVIRPRR